MLMLDRQYQTKKEAISLSPRLLFHFIQNGFISNREFWFGLD
jgi:hypothetical protein